MISTASSKTVGSRLNSAAGALALLMVLAPSVVATAATPPSAAGGAAADATLAETLFRDGKALMKQGAYAEACPKLAESQRLDPASGTMLALALCYEKQGKLATAWIRYLDAESLGRKDGSADRSKAARERADALEPQLARLEVQVGDDVRQLAGLEIRVDAVAIEQAAWGTAMPVDSGIHLVTVSAHGKKPWQTEVTITKPAERQQVTIGPLEDAPVEPAAAPSAPPPSLPPNPPPSESTQSESSDAGLVAGGLLLGLGVVAVGIGTYLGIRALDEIGEAQDRCSPASCTDSEAIELNESGAAAADQATGLIIGGSVGAVAGLVVLLATSLTGSAPDEPTSAARGALHMEPVAGPHVLGLALGGTW